MAKLLSHDLCSSEDCEPCRQHVSLVSAVTATAAVAMAPGGDEAGVAVAITSSAAPAAAASRGRNNGRELLKGQWTEEEEQRLLEAQTLFPGYAGLVIVCAVLLCISYSISTMLFRVYTPAWALICLSCSETVQVLVFENAIRHSHGKFADDHAVSDVSIAHYQFSMR